MIKKLSVLIWSLVIPCSPFSFFLQIQTIYSSFAAFGRFYGSDVYHNLRGPWNCWDLASQGRMCGKFYYEDLEIYCPNTGRYSFCWHRVTDVSRKEPLRYINVELGDTIIPITLYTLTHITYSVYTSIYTKYHIPTLIWLLTDCIHNDLISTTLRAHS